MSDGFLGLVGGNWPTVVMASHLQLNIEPNGDAKNAVVEFLLLISTSHREPNRLIIIGHLVHNQQSLGSNDDTSCHPLL
jgi:hypothetical protein